MMPRKILSAYFRNLRDAGNAITSLRNAGISNENISIVSREDGKSHEIVRSSKKPDDAAGDIAGKSALGGGLGALLGVAVLALPGVGPFIAAGEIAQAAIGGAAVAGTAAGAVFGGLAGVLEKHGISTADAEYFATALDDGGVLVSAKVDEDEVYDYRKFLHAATVYTARRLYLP